MKSKVIALFLISVLAFCMFGCSKKSIEIKDADFCGTFFVVDLKCDKDNSDKCLTEIKEEAKRLESVFSVSEPNSEISLFNKTSFGDTFLASVDFYSCLSYAREIYIASSGDFNPAMLPVSELWGFAPTSNGDYKVPSYMEIQFALTAVDFSKISFNEYNHSLVKETNLKIDLGGIAKGYIVDKLATIANRYNASGLINLGGNIYSFGNSKIGIADPASPNDYMAIIEIENTSICTSGNYERYFIEDGVRYHHIFAKDGYPADNGLQSVTVIGDNSALCDAISTAVFIGGAASAENYSNNYNVSIVLITSENKVITYGNLSSFKITNSKYKAQQ